MSAFGVDRKALDEGGPLVTVTPPLLSFTNLEKVIADIIAQLNNQRATNKTLVRAGATCTALHCTVRIARQQRLTCDRGVSHDIVQLGAVDKVNQLEVQLKERDAVVHGLKAQANDFRYRSLHTTITIS
jgi:hypothetical protein